MSILFRIIPIRVVKLMLMCMLTVSTIEAQVASPESAPVAPREMLISGTLAPVDGRSIVREIDDPNSGARWLLLSDPANAGGPGRWVLATTGRADEHPAADQHSKSLEVLPLPVVRAGDALVIEEHSAIADARLEAVALAPAAIGSSFKVRLKIGGKIVPALCLGAGRGRLIAESEVQR